ncbi:hypothetical protein DPPB08 [Desulfotalea psychrophila LSv54]|uniref:Uncharacterized protein n=1 Tax=Desulfotalea psychrophila (strain LSv54 / DSM 12343) TaxID=177439 RepID=Q6AIH5_DESPS|nr:hypothetical protein DPPB08 [Desulfotalea psychrophila LSv54]
MIFGSRPSRLVFRCFMILPTSFTVILYKQAE